MKFTTATALFAISASVASAAPAYPTQVPISKAATTTTPYVEQPSIILDFFTVSSVADKSTPVAVSILPVGQQSNFFPTGISVHRSVPTTIVSNGQTVVSNVETVSFLRFGPGPARFPQRVSTTPSSTVAAHTSTPVVEHVAAESASSGLPFTLHNGFQVQPNKLSSTYVAGASPIVSRSAPSFVIPSYKTTIYSTIYAKPSTVSVSVVTIPGKMYTVTQTVHRLPSVDSTPSAKPYVASSSAKESVAYNQKAAVSSSASSPSSAVPLPFTLHNGVQMQRSTLVTSVRSSTTAAPYVASSATPSSSKAAGLPFTLHFGFPMQLTQSSSAAASMPTVHYGGESQSVKATPVAASYTTTSFIKTTPVAAYTSASSATPTSTKKYFFGIF